MYVTEPEVIGVCVRFIAYSCLFIMGDAVAAPIQGILRGYKDVNAPFYSSLIAYWVICMPLGLFLDYRLGHGPYSYWQSLGYRALLLRTDFTSAPEVRSEKDAGRRVKQ